MNSIIFSKTGIEVSVSVYVFRENDVYIAYCPSLDLSGYDTTEDAARKDFEYMLDDYMRHQMQNNTLHKDLERHGWKYGAYREVYGTPTHGYKRPKASPNSEE